MNKSIIFSIFFICAFACAGKSEAKTANIFKDINTLQRSPWDPREEPAIDNHENDESPAQKAEEE